MNVQFRSFRPFRRARPLAAFLPRGLRLGSFQKAGLDIGTGLLSLEHGDLIAQVLGSFFQLLNTVLLDPNNGEQTLDQRRALFGGDIGKLHLHTTECKKTSPDQLRQYSGLLRSYLVLTACLLASRSVFL